MLTQARHANDGVQRCTNIVNRTRHIAAIVLAVLLLVRARDNSDLRRVVLEELQAIPAVTSTRTALVFEDFEPTRD